MTVRVFVEVWCEIDPTLNVRVDRQTARPVVEPGDQLWRVSPLGRAAVAVALGLDDPAVTAFAVGAGHEEALRHALAAGAARAVELRCAGDAPEVPPVASLAAWLRRQQADLVIAGRLAGLVAARLGWAHLAGLGDLQVCGSFLHAVRWLERGNREQVAARLPAAVRLHDEGVRPPYVARARLQAAAGRAVERETLPVDEAPARGVETGPLQPARARTRAGTPAPTAASAGDRLHALLGLGRAPAAAPRRADRAAATPEEMAEEFVRYLLHHNLLEHR